MTQGPLPDYQRHRIASCIAAGMPAQLIAQSTGISEDRILRNAREPNPAMQQLIDHYRFQQNATLVKFKMETAELVDEDSKAFDNLMASRKLPKDTEAEQEVRLKAMAYSLMDHRATGLA